MRINPKVLPLASLAAMLLLSSPVAAQVPANLLLEGALTSSGGAAADGDYKIAFGLYNAASGGSAIWSETADKVKVAGGRFVHTLGSIKAVDGKAFAGKGPWFLGIKVGEDAELPRQAIGSVAFALRAATADAVACSGCVAGDTIANGAITAAKVGFAYAGAADGIKGGPAKDVKCTGCVSATTEVAWDGDLDLKGKALTAGKIISGGDIAAQGTVSANAFVGNGSKLTGIKTPAGACKSGEVVTGINNDGSLKCEASKAGVQPDNIDEVSNGLIHNQYSDVIPSKAAVNIPDNKPTGVTDIIDFPDIGTAQDLSVTVEFAGHQGDAAGAAGVKDLRVLLFPPGSGPPAGNVTTMFTDNDSVGGQPKAGAAKHYFLHDKSGAGLNYKTTYPTPTKPKTGNLSEWIGKNPKGKWYIVVIDTKFRNNGVDGQLKSWTINIKTLSNKKVRISGDLYVEGKIYGKDNGHGKVGGPVVVGSHLTAANACDADHLGALRYDAKWGTQVCRKNFPKSGAPGYKWVPAKPTPAIWSGGCKSHNRSSSWQIYCLNATDYDYSQGHFTIASNRMNIKTSGVYRIKFYTIKHGCGQQNLAIYVNGSHKSYAHTQRWEGPNNNYWRYMNTQYTGPLKNGDYVEARAYHDGCGNQYNWHYWTAAGSHSRVTIEFVGPLPE